MCYECLSEYSLLKEAMKLCPSVNYLGSATVISGVVNLERTLIFHVRGAVSARAIKI